MAKKQSPKKPDPKKTPGKPVPANAEAEKVKIGPLDPPPPSGGGIKGT